MEAYARFLLADKERELEAVLHNPDFKKALLAYERVALWRYQNTGDSKWVSEALDCRVGLKAFTAESELTWKQRAEAALAARDQALAELAKLREVKPDMWWLWDDAETDTQPEDELEERDRYQIVRFQTAFRGPDQWAFWSGDEENPAYHFFDTEAEAEKAAALLTSQPAPKAK